MRRPMTSLGCVNMLDRLYRACREFRVAGDRLRERPYESSDDLLRGFSSTICAVASGGGPGMEIGLGTTNVLNSVRACEGISEGPSACMLECFLGLVRTVT